MPHINAGQLLCLFRVMHSFVYVDMVQRYISSPFIIINTFRLYFISSFCTARSSLCVFACFFFHIHFISILSLAAQLQHFVFHTV